MNATRILIIGATSAIAEATARLYAVRGAAMYLLARDARRLTAIASDLRVRGATRVDTATFDAANVEGCAQVIERAWVAFDGFDVALIAHGTLPEQSRCDADVSYALDVFAINCTAAIALTGCIARRLEAQTSGTVAVISSVAGDRGRASNYLYGAAKAAISTYLSGLRQRLNSSGVNVITIKPGFINTPMTAAFKKGALWADPEQIARGIVRAIDARRAVVYLPWFWRPIMFVVRAIPERLFRRLKF